MSEIKGSVTILLVDDEEALRRAIAIALARKGYKVIEAGGGDEAWALLQSHRVDLVISDIRMPRGDGLSLLKRIRTQLLEPLAVILISGYTDIEVDEAPRLGATAYLQKPFDFRQLLGIVEKVAERARDAHELDERCGPVAHA